MTMTAALPRLLIEPIIRAALLEDLGRAGDVTSNAVIAESAEMTAELRAREVGVAAGLDCAALTFELIDPRLKIDHRVVDGAGIAPGDVLMRIVGSARSILAAERVALNFAGRLSGVASLTKAMVDAVAHTSARIADTRKTTPGLRSLEKQAVRLGGGSNHRFGLDDAILIKDNHIAVAGGVREALRGAKAAAGHLLAIEIEVDRLEQLDEALAEGGAHAILLDNMSPELLTEAVRRRDRAGGARAALEASGGVRLETVAAIAESGVDYISAGALTHSARVLDLGLDVGTA
ncbi:MAG: carboxylating nicotinate-nucleotide diphosphorylase [Neomegalonema sp.]|nr:carboxylating nicotinate-nucleotide diphosphorylase [Neomegalonema sp.]